MTQVIYYSNSIGKTISVFAIECAIIFSFIILLMFCCTLICSSNTTLTDKNNKFIFKKYSSKYKIPKEQIDLLYIDDINTQNNQKSNTSNTSNTTNTTNTTKTSNTSNITQKSNTNFFEKIKLFNLNCFKSKNQISLEETKNKETKDEETKDEETKDEETKDGETKDEETKDGETKDGETKDGETKDEETKDSQELKTIEEISDTKENTDLDKQVLTDIESGVFKNKIYIVYEFNNLDKTMKASRYIESDGEDEFDKLEEFVNTIIKSFDTKYDQIGVLLKISSPGGVAYKFEHAYLNLLRLRDKKIELIGMIDKMAASGGYMLASACDKIICSRYATIGSVGVLAQMYNWSELSKKIGMEEKTWTTGSHKIPFPSGSSYTLEDDLRMKDMINETFDIFKSIVMKARNLTPEQEEQIMMAKTFPGFRAYELNMVDELEISSDYMDRLGISNNIWICEEETKPYSFVNSLLIKNIPAITIGLIERNYNSLLVDKKINNIKLL